MFSTLGWFINEFFSYLKWEKKFKLQKLKQKCTLNINSIYFVDSTNDSLFTQFIGSKINIEFIYTKPYYNNNGFSVSYFNDEHIRFVNKLINYNYQLIDMGDSNKEIILHRENDMYISLKKLPSLKDKIKLL